MANFDETSQERSLDGAFLKLFKGINSMQNSGCHGNRKENKIFLSKTTGQIQI